MYPYCAGASQAHKLHDHIHDIELSTMDAKTVGEVTYFLLLLLSFEVDSIVCVGCSISLTQCKHMRLCRDVVGVPQSNVSHVICFFY